MNQFDEEFDPDTERAKRFDLPRGFDEPQRDDTAYRRQMGVMDPARTPEQARYYVGDTKEYTTYDEGEYAELDFDQVTL